MTRPTVGRIVHYVSQGSPVREDGTQRYTRQCRAATVTEVGDGDTVGLVVHNPSGQFFRSLNDGGNTLDTGSDQPAGWSCDGAEHDGGTWHWPAFA